MWGWAWWLAGKAERSALVMELGARRVDLATLLKAVPDCPRARGEKYLPHIVKALPEAACTTPKRVAAFLAQCGHESGGFQFLTELDSGAKYEGRADLGNTVKGDGPKFRGRGAIQITGRLNFTRCGKVLGLDLVSRPELAALPENAFRVSAWYWLDRKLNRFVDANDFAGLTRAINGGLTHLAQRQDRYADALAALGVSGGGNVA